MRCSTCGHGNRDTARFCEACGNRLATVCSQCSNELRPGARFCDECGQAVQAPTTPSATATPLSYTPRHLAEKILAGRDGLAGERKLVTILFADVVGSTELIRDLDPEEAQHLLDGAVTRMMDAVHRYEGTVSRVMGDGIMALFGAPVAHEDHAVRACYVALAMQDAIRRYADEVRRAHGVEIEIRVGLNSGEVVVRLISDDLHMDYTALGSTVHLASRMEQLARASTTRLTADTLALVEGYVQVRALGPVPVKGMPDPIAAYELIGAADQRTRLQVAAARGLTPFVGRETEMAALHAALGKAQVGQGQVVALMGEPGVGKSRLVWEATHSHRTQDWLVLESGSVSHGKATPWLPVIDLLKAYCRIEPRDDARTVREKVLGKLLALDGELGPLVPPLLALLDQPVDDPEWLGLDALQRRQRTLDGVRRLLLRESRSQPVLLVFEDLHWVDSETQVLLDNLVDGLPAAHIVLLVNYRPEYRHDWGSKTYYTQVRVDPLAAEGAQELLTSLLGDHESLGPVAAMLIERTAGNPFFLEECIRTLVETGALIGERGAYRLAHPVDVVRVPATVQAMLAARIDRLAPEEKRLLQTASVVGKDVAYELLREIADRPDDALRSDLGRLQSAEMMYETAIFPGLEYTFKHALTHEVAYGSLLQERRRELHGRIVGAIERLYRERLAEYVGRLADHAIRAERWEDAVRYARQAGARSVERVANTEALHRYDQALGALAHLPGRRETLEQAVDIRLEMRPALMGLYAVSRLIALLREAEDLALKIDDVRRLARVRALMIRNLTIVGEIGAAVATGEQVVQAGQALNDPSIWIPAAHLLTDAHRSRGDFRAAVDYCRQIADATRGDLKLQRFGLVTITSIVSRGYLVRCLAQLGETRAALAVAEEAVRMAEEAGHTPTLGYLLALISDGYVTLGQTDLAMVTMQRYHALVARDGDINSQRQDLAFGGAVYAAAGRDAEALPFLEATAEWEATSQRVAGFSIEGVLWLGTVYVRAGRIDDAQSTALRLVNSMRLRDLPAYLARALCLAADVAAAREPSDARESETQYREALGIAEQLEMRPLQAHCHLGLGKLYRAVDRGEEAQAELSTAVEMFRDMDLTRWLPEAGSELAAYR